MRDFRAGALALLCALGAVSCNTAAVKRGYMSLDAQGDRHRTIFYTDTDTIFCIGEMAIGRKDATLGATFRALDFASPPKGDYVATDTVLAVTDTVANSTGDDVTASFQLLKKRSMDPWPAGYFQCEISIDGVKEETIPFEIRYPDCPFQPSFDGDNCLGFFLPGATCPGADSAQTCVCSDAGAWQCR